MPTRCNRLIFIAHLIACSTCFGHHYAHHQELESIIQVVAACRIWCLVFKLSVWCGAEGCASGLRATTRKPDTQPSAPHAQKIDFVFRRNGRVHFNRQGRQFSRLLTSEVCAPAIVMVVMLDAPCSEVV